jgi:hypothetical protein
MANKRFLGLGFTFAAIDKGLEKKLQSVHSHLSGISDALNNINKSGASSGMSSVGKMLPSPSGSTGTAPSATKSGKNDKSTGESKESENPFDTFRISTFLKGNKKVSKGTENFIKSLADLMIQFGATKDALTDFAKMKVTIEKQSKELTEESVMDLFKSTSNFIKASSDVTSSIEGLAGSLKGVREYIGEVKNSFLDFLSSVGFDLRSMIPKELMAFGGLAKSIFKPLTELPGKLFQGAQKTLADQLQARANEKLGKIIGNSGLSNELLQKLSEQIGGSGTGQENLFAMAAQTATNTKPGEKSGGFFSKIFGMFGKFGGIFSKLGSFLVGIPVLGPLFSAMGTAISAIISPLKVFGSLVLSAGGQFARLLLPMANLLLRLTGIGTILAVVGTALAGFSAGLYSAREGVLNFISGAFSFIQSIGSYLAVVTKGIPFVEQLYAGISSLVSFIANIPSMIMSLFSNLFDASKSFGKILGESLGSVGKFLKDYSTKIDQEVIIKQKQLDAVNSQIPLMQKSSPQYREMSSRIMSDASIDAITQSNRTQQESVGLLREIADKLNSSSESTTKVVIQTNDRAFAAKQERVTNSELGRSGAGL